MPNCAVISIGTELLLGKTLNSNLAYLATELSALGLPVEFSLTVKDEPEAIREAMKQCWGRYDIVITTGGLGPTKDDLTKRVIADFFGLELVFDPEIWEQVQSRFAARQLPTPRINRGQAMVPRGFTALANERGTAPGMFYAASGKCFFAFAGVPAEMKYVFKAHARDILIHEYGRETPIIQRTLHSFGISESALAEALEGISLPEDVNLAWLPQSGRVDLRFYGTNANSIDSAINDCLPLIGQYLWGQDEDTPASVLHRLFKDRGLTLSIAESCTGGLLQSLVTQLPGASDFFLGGVVSYSNALKQRLLKVSPETLASHGAVSEVCAIEMARGIKDLTESAAAISVTGIAGPEGGSESKPVGTVCFGFSVLHEMWSLTQIFSGDRNLIRHKAAEFAILHLIKHLQGT